MLGLTKVGSGTATLNVPGSYMGSTVVSNGTISLGANQTFANLTGSGTVSTASGAPTLTVTNNLNTTFAGSLQGGLGLTKMGSGTLTLTSTNTVAGNVFAKGGTMVINNGSINSSTLWASIGQDGSDNATLNLIGTGAFTNSADFNIGDIGSSIGTVNVSNNAALTVSAIYVGSANAAGSTASGTVNQAASSVQTAFLVIGGRGPSTNGVGVYNLSGGTLTDSGTAEIGGVGTGTLNVTGAAAVSIGAGTSYVGYRTGIGTLNFNGGSLSVLGELRVGGSDVNGATNVATGTMTVSNATVGLGSLTIARGNYLDNSCSGTVTLKTGSTLISTNDVDIQFAGTGNGKLAIDGGTFIIGPTATKWLMLGWWDAGAGELDITNGNLFLENGTSIKMTRQNNTGGNVINQIGGNVTFFSDAGVTVGGGGNLDLDYNAGANASSSGTYNLNGGTLTVPQIIATRATGNSTFNFNGGTLKAAASSATFMQGLTYAYVNSTASIDTSTNTIAVGQVLLDGGSGAGLTKNGNGTLQLNGVNTYTGPTMVNAGLLGGTGTIAGTVTVNSGAGLAPGDSIGTLTVSGNLVLNAGSTNVFEVNGSTPTNDVVALGGSVTYGGVLKIVPTGSFIVNQTFTLFTGAGAVNASNFAGIENAAPGVTFGFTNGILTVVTTVNLTPTNLTAVVNGSSLELSWPADHIGWFLQAQTNALSVGLSNNWVTIPNTDLGSSYTNTINPTNGTVFYRMYHP